MYEWCEDRKDPKHRRDALGNTAPQTLTPSDVTKEDFVTVSQIIKKPKEKINKNAVNECHYHSYYLCHY